MIFRNYINTAYPDYIMDEFNQEAIETISDWCAGIYNERCYPEKGLLLMGDYGTGKTNLMVMLSKYVMNTKKSFHSSIMWHYAASFAKDGHEALEGLEDKNRFFDEMCLIDDRNKIPQREIAMYYGNKVMVGEEIIMKRYDAFKYNGLQTHFTSNASMAEIEAAYGGRVASRLKEMCNIVALYGRDRRGGKPTILVTDNKDKQPGIDVPIQTIKSNIDMIEQSYQEYINNEGQTINLSLIYTTLLSFGVKLCDEAEYEIINLSVRKMFYHKLSKQELTVSQKNEEKEKEIIRQTKESVVLYFYKKMKEHNALSIFGIVDSERMIGIYSELRKAMSGR